jgi:hypothetical protein
MSDNKVRYTFYLDNAGQAVTGATPVFEQFIDVDASVLGHPNPTVELVAAAAVAGVPILELDFGFYCFEFDWDVFSGDSYLVKITCGSSTEFVDPAQRFIIMKLDRTSNVENIVDRIETASTNITTSANALTSRINRLLEVELGSWKIELENSVYVLNLYPALDAAGANARYETGLDINQPIATYYLQDETGISSATNPYQRIQKSATSIKPLT